jgi:general secretion pathway protein K
MRRDGFQRERGSVTILVLWGVAVVFVLLAAAGFTTRTEILVARNAVTALRVREAAAGGTQLGLARLLAERAAGVAVFDGRIVHWQDGPVSVAIAIHDEAGKIDLNQAPFALLAGLFEAVGRPPADAVLLACRISLHRGTPAPQCPEPVDAGRAPVEPALFTAPEELAALPGMDDRLYDAVADSITVATGAAAIDPEVAPRTVLLALPGATPQLVDDYLEARDAWRAMAPESTGFETLPGYPYLTVSPDRDFTVSAVATSPDGARFRADLQLRLTGEPRRPYAIIAWRTPPLRAGSRAMQARAASDMVPGP